MWQQELTPDGIPEQKLAVWAARITSAVIANNSKEYCSTKPITPYSAILSNATPLARLAALLNVSHASIGTQ